MLEFSLWLRISFKCWLSHVLQHQVEDSWKALEFIVLSHKDSKDVFILGGTDEIQQVLDDSNINVATIASSRHVGPIKSRVDEWVKQLDLFGKTLVSEQICCFYTLTVLYYADIKLKTTWSSDSKIWFSKRLYSHEPHEQNYWFEFITKQKHKNLKRKAAMSCLK